MTTKVKVQEQSPKWKLNKEDLVKIFGWGSVLAASGGIIDKLAEIILQIDFGEYSQIIYMITPIVVNILRKLIQGNKA